MSYDYVIVGGGTAGCVLAARLHENAKISVLLLEAGNDTSQDPRTIIPAMWPMTLGSEMDWKRHTTNQVCIPLSKFPIG